MRRRRANYEGRDQAGKIERKEWEAHKVKGVEDVFEEGMTDKEMKRGGRRRRKE